jgi:hypothetical protein
VFRLLKGYELIDLPFVILGFFSFILVHEFFHLLFIKIFRAKGKNIFLIKNKPLWKQPNGLIALSGHLGECVYLGLLLIHLLCAHVFDWHVPLFMISATLGVLMGLFLACSGASLDVYYFKGHSSLIKKGCVCGNREFITGVNDTKCKNCGKILFQRQTGLITAAHLYPTYAFSKKVNEFKHSMRIKASPEKVYEYFLEGFSKAFIRRFKIKRYRKTKNTLTYEIGGIRVKRAIIQLQKPTLMRYRIEFGTNSVDEKVRITRENNDTVLTVEDRLSFFESEKILRKTTVETLTFMKKEIESRALQNSKFFFRNPHQKYF